MSNLTTELLSTFSIFDGLNNEQVKEFIPHIKPSLINKNDDIINSLLNDEKLDIEINKIII